MPELRCSSPLTIAVSPSAPRTYAVLVKPIPIARTGAAARSAVASSMYGGYAKAVTGARGIVGSITPPAAIAPNRTREA